MSKEANYKSQITNLQAQNARIIKDLDEAKAALKRNEDAVYKYEPLWLAAERQNEELEAELEMVRSSNVECCGYISRLESGSDALAEHKNEIGRLRTELAEYQWVSVEDRLPEEDGIYLTKYKGDGRQGLRDEIWIRTYYFGGIYSDFWNPKKPHKYTVTHWMPIPPLPKKEVTK